MSVGMKLKATYYPMVGLKLVSMQMTGGIGTASVATNT